MPGSWGNDIVGHSFGTDSSQQNRAGGLKTALEEAGAVWNNSGGTVEGFKRRRVGQSQMCVVS